MKLLTVIGARPQFIKAAAFSHLAAEKGHQEIIVHTGQHFDKEMSQVFFDELGIPKPKHNLNIHSLPHGAMTGRMLEGLEGLIQLEMPDAVILYGDTNSTLAGALAASKLHIPIVHVEAGLRSWNNQMPEEINRIITDKLSSLLFCPSEDARKNLLKEGVEDSKIHIVGDIMMDSLCIHKEKINPAIVDELGINKPFVLATVHRQENLRSSERLSSILLALEKIQEQGYDVVIPVHPALKKNINQKLNLKLIEPQSYVKLLALLEACELVLTDSGGLQKEAFYMAKYCITLRDETEWVELVNGGFNFVVGANKGKIVTTFEKLKAQKITNKPNIYGSGNAAIEILQAIESSLS